MNIATYVWEFDVSTDHGYFTDTSFAVEGRDKHPAFAEDGSLLGYVAADLKLGGVRYTAGGNFDIANNFVKMGSEKIYISTEKDAWTRITVVVNIALGEERTETVPAYVKEGDYAVAVEGKTVDIQVVDVTGSTVSIYVDGQLLNSVNYFNNTQFFGGAMPKDYLYCGYIDDLRIKNYPPAESSICYDNIIFMPIRRDSGVDLGIFDENGNIADEIADDNRYFGIMDSVNEVRPNPIINVDGKGYASVAAANAAIKEGSIVELLANVSEPIEINYNNIKFVSRGYTYPGFISAGYTTLDYSAARGALYTTPADASEIVNVEYAYQGIEVSMNAVLGTYLKNPEEFGVVAKILNTEEKQYQTLLGWSTVDGENAPIVTAGGTVYPVVDAVKAVVIYWTDASGLTILDTDYYFPGDASVLNAFDGVDIAIDHSADYYGYGRVNWAGIEEATLGLATSGEYTITAVMGKVAPDSFPGLKYNFSTYTNYVLNLYVPMNIEGISNLTVSTVEDGSILFTQFADGTLEGVPYHKYGTMLGLASTEINTYYIVYYVDGQKVAFPVTIGVPTYAELVMAMYDEDTSAKAEAAKTLIVNMANYASKVLALNDADLTVGGAKIYADIVAAYGAKYLTYYNTELTDSAFSNSGTLYGYHKDANWVTKQYASEGDAEAASYIESISFVFDTFEPRFIIKLSDAAVDKGLQKPSSSGTTSYYGYGLHAYTGYYTSVYNHMWAEKDGKVYYGGANIWTTNGDKSYDYYMAASNTTWDNLQNPERQEYYKVQYIRNKLEIKFYWSPDASTTNAVGVVNYSLPIYIHELLGEDAEGNFTKADANREFIDAAKALYAYSYVSAAYKSTK